MDIEKRKGERKSVVEIVNISQLKHQQSQTRINALIHAIQKFYEKLKQKLHKKEKAKYKLKRERTIVQKSKKKTITPAKDPTLLIKKNNGIGRRISI